MDPYRRAEVYANQPIDKRVKAGDFLNQLEQDTGRLFEYTVDVSSGLEVSQLQEILRKINNIAQTLTATCQVCENSLKEKGVNFVDSDVSVESVRQTFYNMIPQALEDASKDELIVSQNISDEDPFVFSGIAALTLISSIELSRNTPDGIKLINKKVILEHNCPDEFKPFLQELLKIKNGIGRLDSDNLLLLKKVCVANPDKKLAVLPSKTISDLAGVINRVSFQIIQKEKFNELVKDALVVSGVILKAQEVERKKGK